MNKMNRREFVKLTGVLMVCALSGCSGGGSGGGTISVPSPEEEEMEQRILGAINEARKDVRLDGTVQQVDVISQFAEKRILERKNGKSASEIPDEFKTNGRCYKYGGRAVWTETGFSRETLTKEWLVNNFKKDFQTELNTSGKTTIREDLYVGIGVQEQDGIVWYDIIYAHEG